MERRVDEAKKIVTFTDLITWKEAHKLVLDVYVAVKLFPIEEKYALVDQLKRASISVSSCIAEGFSRKSAKDKSQFYRISQGSLTEIQNQLMVARDVGYLPKENFEKLIKQSVVVHKLLSGLIRATNDHRYEND